MEILKNFEHAFITILLFMEHTNLVQDFIGNNKPFFKALRLNTISSIFQTACAHEVDCRDVECTRHWKTPLIMIFGFFYVVGNQKGVF